MEKAVREAWEIVKLGWAYIAGIALGVVAIVEAVEGSHDSAWFWGFWAMTALFLATGWRLLQIGRERDRLQAEIADEQGTDATARRLDRLAEEGHRLKDDLPQPDATPAEWHQAIEEGMEGVIKHWAFEVESEMRRNAPHLLPTWQDANPPDIPLGRGWASAVNARRMVEYSAEKVQEMALELRNGR